MKIIRKETEKMVYVLLAEGFEEIEALAPVDLLRRAGLTVVTVSVGKENTVTGAHGISVATDAHITDIEDCSEAELLLLPGGMPGTTNLNASSDVHRLIDSAVAGGKRIAAICAAPMILGGRGILEGKCATCYPGFEDYLKGSTEIGGRVVTDGLITTAKGAGVAVEFALELITLICGAEISEKIKNGIFA